MTKFFNNVKTAVLLGGMFGLVLLVGSIWGQNGLIIAFIAGGFMNIIAFFFSDKIALTAMRAKEVDEQTAPDLHALVQRLAINANLPMPRVYICPQEAPNAFATGRSPKKAAVAITAGALRLLDEHEIEGVMAHELAHVKNRDTLTSCIAATIAGAISFLGYMALFTGGGNGRDSNPLLGLLMFILAPIAAAVIQMAISRSREYVADADGAAIAGTPHGLISALRKLDAYAGRIPMENEMPTQSHMFIIKPLSATGGDSMFSTHPATENRIAKLMELA